MSGLFSRAIGNVVNPVLEFVDIDGVIKRIDIEEALERVDLNKLLERVDINHHLARVDLDALIERVDIDRLVERSNISAIVARSSSSVFDVVIDGARSQLAKTDQYVQRIGRCACCSKKAASMPPRAGFASRSRNEVTMPIPANTASLAVGVQGRYAGIFARTIAAVIDNTIIVSCFTIGVVLIQLVVQRFMKDDIDEDFDFKEAVWYPIAFYIWNVMYEGGSLAITGRTIGLAICGLVVLNNNTGERVGSLQALLRTMVKPLSGFTIVGVLMGWVRRDGRMLHDMLTYTGVCYSWDAKLAYLRQEAMEGKQGV